MLGLARQSARQEIVSNAVAVTGARLVVLCRFEPATHEVAVEAWGASQLAIIQHALAGIQRFLPGWDPVQIRTSADANPIGNAVYLEGKPVAAPFGEIARGTVDQRILRIGGAMMDLRHGFICPLRVEGSVVGSMAFYLSRPLNDVQRRTCEAFVRQASLALENEHLAEAAQRRAEQAAAAAAILGEVGAAETVTAALEALLTGAVRLLNGTGGAVRLYDPITRLRRFQVIIERVGQVASSEEPVPLVAGSFGARMMDGSPGILVEDYLALDPQSYPRYEVMRRLGYRSAVNVPIVVRGRPIGSLHVNHSEPGYFGQADLSIATALAAQVGVVIERAQTEDARRDAEAGRARLDGALLVARTVAHEINNGLAPISGYADLLATIPEVAGNPTALTFLETIQSAISQTAAKVRRLQRIIRLEETESPLNPEEPMLDLDRSTVR